MAENMIDFKNVSLAFGDKVVLSKVNLKVKTGETVAILGPSGSGKSTLLRILIGLQEPDGGNIDVFGSDNIIGKDEEEWNDVRKHMGMVFQYSALFDFLTVYENVAFGLRQHTEKTEEEIHKIVMEMLKVVGLPGLENNYPATLSGGMKKRIGFARAIAIKPEILLYDEPTAGLDPIMANVITDLMINIRKQLGATALLVTHDMKSAFRAADRVAMIYDGDIVVNLPTEEFKRSKNPLVYNFIHGRELDTVLTDEEKGLATINNDKRGENNDENE